MELLKFMMKAAVCAFAVNSPLTVNADNVTLTSSNLPIIIINTQASINADSKVKGTMKIIDNGEGKENNITDTPNDYDGYIGIKLRGNSSLSFNQKKYTVETWTPEGNDSTVSLLGMPAEADWVLLSPYNDVSMVRDVFAFYMWNEMGHWGPRTRMCEVVVNNEYVGVYALCERIKRDKNRVDINKLKTEDVEGRDVTGGYIVRIDAYDEEDETFTSKVPGIQKGYGGGWGWGGQQQQTAAVTWTVYYPKKEDIQPAQKKYIQSYVDSTELAIQADNFTDPVDGYVKFIDVASFVDYFIHTELSLNADGFKRSAYYYKEKDKKDGTRGKLFAGPVWDYNLAYGNCNFCNANNVSAWVYEGCETNPTPTMWLRLLEDPAFANAVKTRYQQLRKTVISEENINAFLDAYASLLDQAKDRQLKKYNELLKSNSSGNDWGWGWNWGWGGGSTTYYAAYQVSNYAEEIATVKKWFAQRLDFLDKNLPGTAAETGIQELQFYDIDMKYQPSSRLAILSSEKPLASVEIVDVLGSRLRHYDGNGDTQMQIDLNHIGKGVRIIVCYATDGSMISKSVLVKD